MATTHQPKICETCGKSFLPSYPVSKSYWAGRRFCSPPCSREGSRGKPSVNKGRVLKSLEERFWAKVVVLGPDDCWEWRGTRLKTGYGLMHGGSGSAKRWEIAHRVSWMVHFGEIPEELVICHRCDNPPCCNPAHLFLGTKADNNRDRASKGREQRSVNGRWRQAIHCC